MHFTLLLETIDHFVIDDNDAIREGGVPPKSKTLELVPRMAAALHVLNHNMMHLLAGVPSTPPLVQIAKRTLERASEFVQHLESQKEILC